MPMNLLTMIGNTIYYLDNDAICIEAVTDIHITRNNIYYNTNNYVATFTNNNYDNIWFTDIEKVTDAYHTRRERNAI